MTDDLDAAMARVREAIAVCECSNDGATGIIEDGVQRFKCIACGARYESPPRVERKDVVALLAALTTLRAEHERAMAVVDELLRINALYSDALNVIANHPTGGWVCGKATEAIAKTEAARRGEIYAGLTNREALRALDKGK